ncbi:hypothetical protein R1sor_025569 [Riccia sorocarpa]|uniref:Uncharacterized protein n=1 Tax=Riccia sorocarpa TaxID=122646 RepID=A0ABD3GAC4_9MARC
MTTTNNRQNAERASVRQKCADVLSYLDGLQTDDPEEHIHRLQSQNRELQETKNVLMVVNNTLSLQIETYQAKTAEYEKLKLEKEDGDDQIDMLRKYITELSERFRSKDEELMRIRHEYDNKAMQYENLKDEYKALQSRHRQLFLGFIPEVRKFLLRRFWEMTTVNDRRTAEIDLVKQKCADVLSYLDSIQEMEPEDRILRLQSENRELKESIIALEVVRNTLSTKLDLHRKTIDELRSGRNIHKYDKLKQEKEECDNQINMLRIITLLFDYRTIGQIQSKG